MSEAAGTVTLELLGQLVRDMQRDLRAVQSEQRDQLKLLLALVEQGRRTDRHVTELRDDLELMLKAEFMGRMGQFETGVEHRLDALEARMGDLEGQGRQP